MAKDTNLKLRSQNIYQVFLRQHTKEGTFLSLIADLARIKSLGMDYLYLLPIHPIGEKNRKGSIGSPYSIKDFRATNPDYGTIEDFEKLVKEAHNHGLKVMIDIVFNHTSHDSVLIKEHPEWYKYKEGKLTTRVPEWWDIVDLDFSNKDLWEYLIETLEFWTTKGIDGFRCDVAPLIPMEFWLEARKRVQKINPNIVFLSESVHLSFVKLLRDSGYYAASDSETYKAFDILYDYDIHQEYLDYIEKKDSLNNWLESIIRQESLYPANYIKLRNLENHDQPRIASFITNPNKLLNMTALLGYLKGTMMIYAGQEYGVSNRPDLFELDQIDLTPNNMEIRDLIHRLGHLRKDQLFQTGVFNIHLQDVEVAVLSYENETSIAFGIFNVGNKKGEIKIPLPDGIYQNILYPNQVEVKDNRVKLSQKPIIIFSMKIKL
ncbi:MAG: alpha-amylase [Acholeplasmataceae bacterium]|jgi:glycosidase|nr:alpha-amylase [Acholeplasmataceae bacterium]